MENGVKMRFILLKPTPTDPQMFLKDQIKYPKWQLGKIFLLKINKEL